MSMKYRDEKGLPHLDLRIPDLRYSGTVKYIELHKTDRWYASIVIDVKERQESVPKGNLYIDLGIKNLTTVFDGKKVAIYSGGKTSSTNRYRNKKNAEQQAILSTIGKKTSKALRQYRALKDVVVPSLLLPIRDILPSANSAGFPLAF